MTAPAARSHEPLHDARAVLGRLGSGDSAALRLVYGDRLTFAQAALTLNITESAFAARMAAAMKAYATVLLDDGALAPQRIA